MPASSISGPLRLAVKLTEQPKSPNLQTPALVTFTYQVKTLVGAKIKQARLFFTHQNITGLDVQMNHLTLMAMLQSTGDLHRYASSAIDLFVLRSQCLLTWSRKIKLFEPSEDIFRDPTKYWTTKKMWGGVGSFKCPSAFHPPEQKHFLNTSTILQGYLGHQNSGFSVVAEPAL